MSARLDRWTRLRDAGLVAGDLPDASTASAPWYIGAMLGAAAWLAALFLLFFLGMLLEDVVKKPLGAIVCGLAVTMLAGFVLRRSVEHAFVSQLAIAFSLAGQGLVLAGLVMDSGRGESLRWLVFAAFEIALLVAVPHAAHRVLATMGAAAALLMASWGVGLQPLFLPTMLAGFVVAQSRMLAAAPEPKLWHALSVGLVLAVLAAIVIGELPRELLFRRERPALPPSTARWIVAAALACIGAWSGLVVVRDATGRSGSRTGLIAAAMLAALALVALAVPGIAAAIVVLLLAQAAGQPVVTGLSAIALVASLGHYYYQLETTLLAKAGGIAAIGGALLIARAVMLRLVPRVTEDPHA